MDWYALVRSDRAHRCAGLGEWDQVSRPCYERALPVIVVVVDRPCGAVEVAKRADVDARVVEREDFGPDFDRVAYSKQIVDVLHEAEVDLVAMAGFGTILDEPVFDAFPRADPQHTPGSAAVVPRLARGGRCTGPAYGVKVTGCTVHVATLEVDAGPIVAQEPVTVLADDTVDTLHERIKAVERRLYPDTLAAVVAGELALGPDPRTLTPLRRT